MPILGARGGYISRQSTSGKKIVEKLPRVDLALTSDWLGLLSSRRAGFGVPIRQIYGEQKPGHGIPRMPQMPCLEARGMSIYLKTELLLCLTFFRGPPIRFGIS